MLRIERILCPVDFSDASAEAFASAQALARRHKATLYVQHVFDFKPRDFECYAPSTYLAERYESSREEALDRLRTFLEMHGRGGVVLEHQLSGGWAPDAILSFADQQAVDLIVMVTHGRGSTCDRVSRSASCPVVIVNHAPVDPSMDQAAAGGSIRLRRVVVCTDLAHSSHGSLEFACSVAEEYDAEIVLLHVVERVPASLGTEVAITMANQRLHELIELEARGTSRIEPVVRTGRAHEQIIKQASETRADLAVMPVRPRSGLVRALFGSTTRQVMQRGPCPVLTVP